MNEEFVNVFVNGMMRYLKHLDDVTAEVGTPYLMDTDQPTHYDITGIIGISGERKGCVYFTAPRVFLSHLLATQGETNLSDENLLDLSGEIANTIAGNARSDFGKNFQISVPVVVEGGPSSMHLPKGIRSFAIPVTWRKYTPLLVVAVETNS
jgi:chemotaxis protein CheX